MPNNSIQHIELIISGQVQGVGYRKWFQTQAMALNLKGTVQNLSTGEVKAYIQGPADAMSAMIELSWQGPQRAVVQHIQQLQIKWCTEVLNDFRIIRAE